MNEDLENNKYAEKLHDVQNPEVGEKRFGEWFEKEMLEDELLWKAEDLFFVPLGRMQAGFMLLSLLGVVFIPNERQGLIVLSVVPTVLTGTLIGILVSTDFARVVLPPDDRKDGWLVKMGRKHLPQSLLDRWTKAVEQQVQQKRESK